MMIVKILHWIIFAVGAMVVAPFLLTLVAAIIMFFIAIIEALFDYLMGGN